MSGRRGTNLPRMGDYNLRVVLDQIRRSRTGVSRIELSELTGLSAQTITNLVTRLIADRRVVEGARHVSGPGKPRTMLHVRPESGHAIGAHIDPVALTVALVDLSGAVVDRRVQNLPATAAETVDLIADEVRRVRESHEIEHLHGLGVAAPGPIDIDAGRIVKPPALDWGDVPLRDLIRSATGLATILEKDVTAAMAAEIWQRHHDLRGTTLFTYLGYGIGFAFAREGELLTGASGNAGETGHIIVDADGPPCWCGNRGCIGIASSMDYLVERGGDLGLLEPWDPSLPPWRIEVRMERLAALAADGDARARDVLEVCGRRIAHGIVLVADLLDADRVVVGGANWERMRPYVVPAVTEEFGRFGTMRDLHAVEVEGTDLGIWVGAVGAASLVLDRALSPHATALLSTAE